VIDPIDGTKSFIRHVPIWATLVGLEYKGEQIGGVAYLPVLGMTYRALRGDGAYHNDRRVRVSDVPSLADASLCYSSMGWFTRAGARTCSTTCTSGRSGSAGTATSTGSCWWPRARPT
jgi:histidinol-phosphatase